MIAAEEFLLFLFPANAYWYNHYTSPATAQAKLKTSFLHSSQSSGLSPNTIRFTMELRELEYD